MTDTAAASALIYAQKLRKAPDSGRVEMYLNGGDIEQIRQVAIDRGVTQVAWIGDDGVRVEEVK